MHNIKILNNAPLFKFKEKEIIFPKIQSINPQISIKGSIYFSIQYETHTTLYGITNKIIPTIFLIKDYVDINFLSKNSFYLLNKNKELYKNNIFIDSNVLNICLFENKLYYLKKVGKMIYLFENEEKIFEFNFFNGKLFIIGNSLFIFIDILYELKKINNKIKFNKFNISKYEKITGDSNSLFYYKEDYLIEFNKELNLEINKIKFKDIQSINLFENNLYLTDKNFLYLIKGMKIIKKTFFKSRDTSPILFNNLLINDFITFINKDLINKDILLSIDLYIGLNLQNEEFIKRIFINENLSLKLFPYDFEYNFNKKLLKLKYKNIFNEIEILELNSINYIINISFNYIENKSIVSIEGEYNLSFEIKNIFIKKAIKYNNCIYGICDTAIIQMDLSSLEIKVRNSPDLLNLYINNNRIILDFYKYELIKTREVFWGTK